MVGLGLFAEIVRIKINDVDVADPMGRGQPKSMVPYGLGDRSRNYPAIR